MFHALLIVIGILIGIMSELYVVKHKLEKKEALRNNVCNSS